MLVLAWMLNLVYIFLLTVLSPILLDRALRTGKYRDGWGQKFLGRLPAGREDRGSRAEDREPQRTKDEGQRTSPRLWLHAVSVGEVLQLEPVLKVLRERRPDVEVVVTTTTATGRDVARGKFPDDTVCYFPLDFSWAVRRALDCIQPSAVILVELELWPNFILEADRRGVPLMLINGRLSEHSFRGYRRIRPLVKHLLERFRAIAVQNETYRRRFLDLGAPEERLHVTGSIKFDRVAVGRADPRTRELRTAFDIADGERVFIAGSTQHPEEEYALETWLELRDDFPDLRLILVPRHKERFEEVAALIRNRGLPLLRRTESRVRGDAETERRRDGEKDWSRTSSLPLSVTPSLHPAETCAASLPVLLLDTLGELSACWGLADVAFVGGSFGNRGGQNMIEPAAYGAAVLFGPNTRNFRDVVESLLSHEAARVVSTPGDLSAAVRHCLRHPGQAQARGRRAQQLVLSQRGATDRTVEHLMQLLVLPKDESATSGRCVA